MSPIALGLIPKMKPISPRRSAVVCALDIGTSKIACLIARLRPCSTPEVLRRRTHAVEVLGIGHTRSGGIKGGTVVNLVEAEQSIGHAVDAAERAAGVHVESVILSVSAGRMTSERYAAKVPLRGPVASEGDIARVLAAGSQHSVRDGRAVMHSLPIGYSIDEARGIRDPRGMLGRNLGVDMHVATIDGAAARNLMLAVERCHLSVEAMVAAPYVAGVAVLADDEADLGAAVVDIGAGTTTVAVFSGGRFVHADGFALGGSHITLDLARGLSARLADAERIKTLHGNAIAGPSDDRDVVPIPSIGEDEGEPPHLLPRAALVRIISPRVEEILEMVRDRLAESPFAAEPGGRVILTGGASQLAGLPDLAMRILGRQARIGRPLGISGLSEATKGPAFAAAAGLLIYPQLANLEQFEARRLRPAMTGTDGYFTRVGRWLRESF
jgi:cell division protein FtsA